MQGAAQESEHMNDEKETCSSSCGWQAVANGGGCTDLIFEKKSEKALNGPEVITAKHIIKGLQVSDNFRRHGGWLWCVFTRLAVTFITFVTKNNSASVCLGTIIAPDVWTSLPAEKAEISFSEENIRTYSLAHYAFFIGSKNTGWWLYEAMRNCIICPNGLVRGHLEHGRAPRLSLCHLSLCTFDTLLFEQNVI